MPTSPVVNLPPSGYIRANLAPQYLGVSRATFYRMRAAGQVPKPVNIAARIAHYPVAALDAVFTNAAGGAR